MKTIIKLTQEEETALLRFLSGEMTLREIGDVFGVTKQGVYITALNATKQMYQDNKIVPRWDNLGDQNGD